MPTVTGLFIPYVTRTGDRWDSISWVSYGDPTLINDLIMANPQLRVSEQFPAGITVQVPILAVSPSETATDLPPWRQGV